MAAKVPRVVIHEDRLQELETGLGIDFSVKAYENAETLGGLFDGVWNELAPLASGGGRCPTAVSFYQIKPMILHQCPDLALTPSTPLADIPNFEYAKLQAELRRKGWSSPIRFPLTKAGRMADLSLHYLWPLSALLCVAAICAVPMPQPFALLSMIASLAASFFATALLRERCLFRKGLPVANTVGELAQDIARLNLRRLRATGATGLNRAIVWGLFARGATDRSAVIAWDFD